MTIRTIAVISIAVFLTRLFVGITASVSMLNVNRLAIYTDTRPPWERGEVTDIRLLLVGQSPSI